MEAACRFVTTVPATGAFWTPRDTPEPGLRSRSSPTPDGNLVELLSSEQSSSSRSPSPWLRLTGMTDSQELAQSVHSAAEALRR